MRVFGFIAMGVFTIFLTFFTNDNALELVISGIASVFIGIGVNNYTVVEDREKQERYWAATLRYCIRNLDTAVVKAEWMAGHASKLTVTVLEHELEDLKRQIENTADFCHLQIRQQGPAIK